MQIEIHRKERGTLAEFADAHGLTMVIRERTPFSMGSRFTEDVRYYAQFKNCEVKDRGMLIGAYGNGATPDEAMEAYANEISEKTIVIDAGRDSRKEIDVPILTTEKQQ